MELVKGYMERLREFNREDLEKILQGCTELLEDYKNVDNSCSKGCSLCDYGTKVYPGRFKKCNACMYIILYKNSCGDFMMLNFPSRSLYKLRNGVEPKWTKIRIKQLTFWIRLLNKVIKEKED